MAENQNFEIDEPDAYRMSPSLRHKLNRMVGCLIGPEKRPIVCRGLKDTGTEIVELECREFCALRRLEVSAFDRQEPAVQQTVYKETGENAV